MLEYIWHGCASIAHATLAPATMNIPVNVSHNAAAQRFEAMVNGQLCRAEYRRHGDTLALVHTEVPQDLEGRGIAAQLVYAALAYARAQSLTVQPICSYVRAYMQRHPHELARGDERLDRK